MSDVQFWKAPQPMDVTVSGRKGVTLPRDAQSLKVQAPMVVSVSGSRTEVMSAFD